MAEPSTTMTVRLSAALKKRLDRLAKSTSRSRSWLAVDAIQAYLDLQEWQIDEINAGLKEAEAGDFASEEEVQRVIDKWTRHDR